MASLYVIVTVMKLRKRLLFYIFLGIFGVFILCEYFIYFIVIIQCSWPVLSKQSDFHFHEYGKEVYAMFVADTHLLGRRNGHWFDKLRREWQMYRAFQTSLTIHQPEVVFFLGDIFDEGLWSSGVEFNEYVERFNSIFAVPENTKTYVVVGNHDVGFHYKITPYLIERFSTQLKSPSVNMVSIRGNHFVMINSMAMEGDGCFLCSSAEMTLQNITSILRCSKGAGNCDNVKPLEIYSKPILLQHFPLYRVSDEMCTEPDSAPLSEKSTRFRERWECLSRESTEFLIESLKPRLALGGHTHHSCFIQHNINELSDDSFTEYSIPSFSWRNRNDPSFLLGVFTPNYYKISKCKMPKENTVILIYVTSPLIFISAIIVMNRQYKFKLHKHY